MQSSKSVFKFPIRVYWEDTDAGGIVFYANYLKFFERARTEWLRSLGIEQFQLKESTGGMFVVAESQVRYVRPEQSGQIATLVCEGSIRIGWVNAAKMQPARIPPQIVDRFLLTSPKRPTT
jgi:acyl-CoA thioester hydrolase